MNVLKHLSQKQEPNGNQSFTPEELQAIERKIHGKRVYIGIKRLIGCVDAVKKLDQQTRVMKFIMELEEDGCLSLQG
jgi:vesicle-fusing ATPase